MSFFCSSILDTWRKDHHATSRTVHRTDARLCLTVSQYQTTAPKGDRTTAARH